MLHVLSPPPPPCQEEFDACELPSKERRDALAAALQIPARSVQVTRPG